MSEAELACHEGAKRFLTQLEKYMNIDLSTNQYLKLQKSMITFHNTLSSLIPSLEKEKRKRSR